MNSNKILRLILIFLCLALAITADVLDIVSKFIKLSGILFVLGFLIALVTKLGDLFIFFLLLITNIFEDDETKISYTQYRALKRFILKNRRIIAQLLLGVLPENAGFWLGGFLVDGMPFRTLSILIIIIFEFNLPGKFLKLMKKNPLAKTPSAQLIISQTEKMLEKIST